jgi:OmcA/MtrC family decaheme c-type cytochrome
MAAAAVVLTAAWAQTSPQYQYNIQSAVMNADRTVTVRLSVTNPVTGQAYDILNDMAFLQTASGASRLFLQIGWDTRDYHNTGGGSELAPSGAGAALPIGIDVFRLASPNGDGTYTVKSRPLPSTATGTGVAALEGHPAERDASGAWTIRTPVKSVYKYFAISGPVVARRQIVDVAKCKNCHGTLTLHGNNRTDEPLVCVICHNPNATDVPFRQAADGPEAPIDFKYMVHAIHGTKRRQTPFVIIGRGHSINDFSDVRFPAEPSDCTVCHLPGTNALPLGSNVLGTTIVTQSTLRDGPPIVNNDPADDLNITPMAAVCSACHDSTENRRHMESRGASFAALQQQIASGVVRERCGDCHGKGKEKDVLRVHHH